MFLKPKPYQRASFRGSKGYPRGGLQFYADLWHPEQQGFLLSYDGNDYLSNATADFRSADSSGAIEVWFRIPAAGQVQTLFASSDTGTTTSNIQLYTTTTTGLLTVRQLDNGGAATSVAGSTNVCDGKWHHAVLSSSGTAYTILLDGVAETLTGTNDGDWFADTTLRDNLTIGAMTHTSTLNYLIGEQGYTRIYSRPMLQPEAQLNYQRGRKASASDTTGLVFNLPTTEGTGNPVDTVGSLTMTLTGATWVEGLMDRSTNAYSLSSFSSPIWGNTGRTFASGDYIEATATALNFTTSDFSFVAWIKPTDLTINRAILYRGAINTDGYFWLVLSDGKLDFYTAQAAAMQNTNSSAGSALKINNWYMVAVTRVGAAVKHYKNGVNVTGTTASHIDPVTSSRTLKIGIRDDKSNDPFIGVMGDVPWAYNRALTAPEILQIFNSTRWRYGV